MFPRANIANNLQALNDMSKLSQKIAKLRRDVQVAEEEIANDTQKDSYEVYLTNTLANAQIKLDREMALLKETFERRQERLMKELEDLKDMHERKVRKLQDDFEKTKNHCDSNIQAIHDRKQNTPKLRRLRAELKVLEQEGEEKRTTFCGEAPAPAPISTPPPPVLEKNQGCVLEEKIPAEPKKKRKVKVAPAESVLDLPPAEDGFPVKCSMTTFATQLNNGNFDYIRAIRNLPNTAFFDRFGFTSDQVFQHQCELFGTE